MIRPRLHFTPPGGWMNDPNGLVYLDGEYHLFYQHHPNGLTWGPMHWGHAVSRDLLRWQHLPIALYPDEVGMIYSGSAVVDWSNTAGFGAGTLVAVFTYHQADRETQHLAFSLDRGRTWNRYEGNPVLTPPPGVKDFRDPRVFWHVDHWVMCLAAGDEIRFFVSPDLKVWTPSGEFGRCGSVEGVWETPDLFPLPVDGGPETHWVLTVGVGKGGPAGGSGTQYFVGQFDGSTFTSENPPGTILWMDHGSDLYAPQSWNEEPHGRRVMLAWMNNWRYANTVPAETWRGMFSLPRELTLVATEQGIRLAQQPIREIKAHRGEHLHWRDQAMGPGENLLAGTRGDCLEILADLTPDSSVTRFGFRVRVGAEEATVIVCDMAARTLSVDRTRSGQVSFVDGFAAVHSAPLPMDGGEVNLRILLDRSSVEVFAGHGRVTLTESIFPAPESQGLDLFVEGGLLYIRQLEIYSFD